MAGTGKRSADKATPRVDAYTEADKDVALAAVCAAQGDFQKAQKVCGVPAAVLEVWWRQSGETSFTEFQKPSGPKKPAKTEPLQSAGQALESAISGRPLPPEGMRGEMARSFPSYAPSPELVEWARQNFILETGPIANPEHWHLEFAKIGFLWTSEANSKARRTVAGTCEMPFQGGAAKWVKGRMLWQLSEWFGEVPDFLITLDSVIAAQATDEQFCALIDHELYHAGQDYDEFGCPQFTEEGLPMFALKGHDVEEHVGVVQRWGMGAASAGVEDLVRVAMRAPTISDVKIALACGSCQARPGR